MTAPLPRHLVNGRADASIACDDRAFNYGDGVFETIAVRNGHPLLWDAHWQRLQQGCERLGIVPPAAQVVRQESAGLAEGCDAGVLKIVVSRGSGGRGYRCDPGAAQTRLVSLYAWPEQVATPQRDGAVLGRCRTRLAHQPLLAGIKHLNRLEQVLARREWQAEWDEGIMLDPQGRVIEGTMSNLFVVTAGFLLTPGLDACGVAGVMRAQVLASAGQLGLRWREAELRWEDLQAAEEVFMTNSIIGLWPVRELSGQPRKIGAVARRLQEYMSAQDWALLA